MLFQTVTAVNYLPMTLVMADTLRKHIPDSRLSILVTDASSNLLEKIREKFADIADFICCDDLGFEPLTSMRNYYSVLEFSSACKILSLDYQLRKKGEKSCYFIDPDMFVMGDFTKCTEEIEKDIVLTYHSLNPYPQDGELPNELELVAAGSINGGFIYMRNSTRSLEALSWLMQHINYRWFVAPAYGMYGDQHWLGFLPQFFGDITAILKAPNVNIAYWNLHGFPLREIDGSFFIGEGKEFPALLMHFSGFPDSGELKLTRHSQRKFDKQTEACITSLAQDYRQSIEKEKLHIKSSRISGDISFSNKPLYKRMAIASKLYNYDFIEVASPVGIFARIGNKLDRLVRKYFSW